MKAVKIRTDNREQVADIVTGRDPGEGLVAGKQVCLRLSPDFRLGNWLDSDVII